MSSISPYRVAWRKPNPVNVRSRSRSAVLEALEYEFPTSKGRLLARTGLGSTTLRRAYRQLLREKVMALKYGRDPDSGFACDLLTLSRYPVLPILELADTYMIWRLCDTLGDSVFATVRDRGGFYTPEDDLRVLMGQVATIIKAGTCGLPAAVPLQAPVLLLPAEDDASAALVRRVLEIPPAFVLTAEESTAHELQYHPATQNAGTVLHLRMDEICHASLFMRKDAADIRSPLISAACAAGLGHTLRNCTARSRPHSTEWLRRIAAFLSDFCRFITPDCVILETDRPVTDAQPLRAALPPTMPLICSAYALNTPSLAHKGALRLTRRVLWESMESDAPEADDT